MKWLPLAVALIGIVLPGSTALAQPSRCVTGDGYPNGAVFVLYNAPHVWLFEDGTLHWVGDTRALTGRTVRWDHTCGMEPGFLIDARKGEPHLSAGLVRIGEPIYLAKWEVTDAAPELWHIQSIDDLRAFGITAENYGRLVQEREQWERQFGFDTASLARQPLASALPPPTTHGGLRFSNVVTGWRPGPDGHVLPVVRFTVANIGQRIVEGNELSFYAQFVRPDSAEIFGSGTLAPSTPEGASRGFMPGQVAIVMGMSRNGVHLEHEPPPLIVEVFDRTGARCRPLFDAPSPVIRDTRDRAECLIGAFPVEGRLIR